MKLLVIYGSSRSSGNSEALTKLTLENIDPSYYEEVYLRDHLIYPIIDQRHDPNGFDEVNDDYEMLVAKLMAADAVLFVTPLYWYTMSGHLKNFIDRFSQSIKNKNYDFKAAMQEKEMYAIVVGGQLAPITALPLIQQFQLISQFLKMNFNGYVIGKGVKPQEVLQDEESVYLAKKLGEKIKQKLCT